MTTVNTWTPGDQGVDPGRLLDRTGLFGRRAHGGVLDGFYQTGGSIVLPSNQQNLTGLKPTMGRVSIHGVIPLSFTRDH